MEIGLALPQFDYSVPGQSPLRWETLARWAVRAEELGFGSLWLADHLFLDLARYGGPPHAHGGFDPLVALGGLARVTRTARLGTLVLCAPLRPATVLAKALASLDVTSGGRLVVGLGAGWYEPEFAAAGVPFPPPGVRLEILAETLQVVKGMFTQVPFSFAGRHARAMEAACLPHPVQQPRPAVWVGGSGDRLMDVVARHADGWNTAWSVTADEYRRRGAVLDAACERAGRDPASVTRSLGLRALVGESAADVGRRWRRLQELSPPGVLGGATLDDWRRGNLVGTVDDVAGQLQGWKEMGVGTLVVSTGAVPFSVVSDDDLAPVAAAATLSAPWV